MRKILREGILSSLTYGLFGLGVMIVVFIVVGVMSFLGSGLSIKKKVDSKTDDQEEKGPEKSQ